MYLICNLKKRDQFELGSGNDEKNVSQFTAFPEGIIPK